MVIIIRRFLVTLRFFPIRDLSKQCHPECQ
jgi:hypothetical protein